MSGDAYEKVLHDSEELLSFQDGMRELMNDFCNAIATGNDFVIRAEIRGNKGHLVHFRLHPDKWFRPRGVERKIAAQGERP